MASIFPTQSVRVTSRILSLICCQSSGLEESSGMTMLPAPRESITSRMARGHELGMIILQPSIGGQLDKQGYQSRSSDYNNCINTFQ